MLNDKGQRKMKMYTLMVLLAAAATGNAALDYTNECFASTMFNMQCSNLGLTLVPPGYWPGVAILYLQDNQITHLRNKDLTGFPGAVTLYLSGNRIQEVDLQAFAPMDKLSQLDLQSNEIARVINSEGLQFGRLTTLDLRSNRITSLEADLVERAPYLTHVHLQDNPLVITDGRPVLIHANLERLNLNNVESLSVGPESFAQLPNLKYIYLSNSGVNNISGAFATNNLLSNIEMDNNRITEVTRGSFAEAHAILSLSLDGNPISRFDVSAVAESPASPRAYMFLRNTPFTCACAHESLYWWAEAAGVHLYSGCDGQPSCAFTRR